MRHLGAILRVHLDQAAFAGGETGRGKIEVGGVALPSGRNEHVVHASVAPEASVRVTSPAGGHRNASLFHSR